ncbi:MAG: DUF4350 domain-containing protein [Bryobacterales bacterium]|nr:DUF4350 domain-containing protein [Bryobacterales bacterium]
MRRLLWLLAGIAAAQQIPDRQFSPKIDAPAFPQGKGPRVLIDEAHRNFHTASGRYAAFAQLLRRDGYNVAPSTTLFSPETFRDTDVLVIANALHPSNENNWRLPTPSAFTPAEIDALLTWIRSGGALLLIADHMPFPGAAMDLGKALGVTFHNGYARQRPSQGPAVFDTESGMLRPHPITQNIQRVATFTGSAFRLTAPGDPLLVFDASFESWQVSQAMRFPDTTPRIPLDGWLQGAALTIGKGRAAVFGEAAMFSAQLSGPNRTPMGMNHPLAAENPLLLRRTLRWLTRR